MVKGDDIVRRKKNKTQRKKLNSSSDVSARIASIIAAKKRRQSGKRRQCQGMCFSLPTPDDPFNDRHGKKDFVVKEKKSIVSSQMNKRKFDNGKNASAKKNGEVDHLKAKNGKVVDMSSETKRSIISANNLEQKNSMAIENKRVQKQFSDYSDCPSKFFILCLNAIEKAMGCEGTLNNEDKPLFVNPWGVEFLKCCLMGKDILDTSGSSSTIEQIAWIVSIAADAITRKEKEGLSCTSPFLLFLVPSQEKAAKVRLVCKPLKDLGIHTVSLHPSASLDHQIRGLKSCEPEFLVSTTERLMELVTLKAIDISGVSFMVVDGLDSLFQDGCINTLKSIRQSISGNPQTVVFNNFNNYACVALQYLFPGSICRLSLCDSMSSQSACIRQIVEVCSSEDEKLLKSIQVLRDAYHNRLSSQSLYVAFIIENDKKSSDLAEILKENGYSVSTDVNYDPLDADVSSKPAVSLVHAENIGCTDLSVYEIVILPDFVLSVDNYVQIVTRMARHTTHGILHSFISEEDALLAGPLIEILRQCGQAVPDALKTMRRRSSISK